MSGVAVVMREVHRLRRHAHELQEQLDRIPRQLKAQQTRVAREETALKDGQDAIKRLKVANHEKEVSLKTTLGKVEKHTKQLKESTTPKVDSMTISSMVGMANNAMPRVRLPSVKSCSVPERASLRSSRIKKYLEISFRLKSLRL